MMAIFSKEVKSFLNSLIAYIVISVFLISIGLLMWVFPETNVFDYGYASMETLFSLAPYVFIFLIPAITMRSFAEEKKTGTMELLFTRPVTDWQVIFGKYLSALLVVLLALAPTLIYYIALYQIGNPVGNIDTPGVIGSYVGLVMLAAVFTSIGLFSSLLTENQIIAFIVGVFLCFILYTGFSSLAAIDVWGKSSLILEQLGILYHYNSVSRGLIDSRHIIYFLSCIASMLLLTKLMLEARKW